MQPTSPTLKNDASSIDDTLTQHFSAREGIALQDFADSESARPRNLTVGPGRDYDDESDNEDLRSEEKTLLPQPDLLQRPSSIDRRLSYVEEDEARPPVSLPRKPKLVSWSDLPHKGQLAILTMARLSEPLTQTSLQAYMFYQLKSFNPSLPDSTIASQAGILQGSFTASQFFTAILWGRASDADWGGRKKVLLIGLLGTCISCVGFGFSRSFVQAVMFRTLGGALNGNVGVMRTMISEIVKEKKFQARAFLLLPMCFNIGVIIGPVLGGILANPVENYPSVFGENSLLGGKQGVWWLKHWPYALPNLLSALFLFVSAVGVIFGLEETLDSLRDRPDLGLRVGKYMANLFRRLLRPRSHHYTAVTGEEPINSPIRSFGVESFDLGTLHRPPNERRANIPRPQKLKRKLPFRRIWTRNVLFNLLTHAFLSFHVGTFQNLWFIFLSTSRFDPSHPIPPSHTTQRLPFSFTGGLGMRPRSVGLAMAVLGVFGISLQILVYPTVNQRFGTLRSYRWSLLLFPLAYCLAPYLSLVPSSKDPPAQASGFLVWMALAGVLLIQVIARTFALPAAIILINNCSPHPSVLGTIHGFGSTVSSLSRSVGPILGGWGFGFGLRKGVVGGVWWALAAVAALGWVASGLVYEGSGHEIFLEGETAEDRGKEVENWEEGNRAS